MTWDLQDTGDQFEEIEEYLLTVESIDGEVPSIESYTTSGISFKTIKIHKHLEWSFKLP